MNSRLFFAVVALSTFLPNFAPCAESPPEIALKIVIPELMNVGWTITSTSNATPKLYALPRRLENRYPRDEKFYVVIENVSSKPVLLGGEDFMDYDLSFEITDEHGEKTAVHHHEILSNGKPAPALRLEPGEASIRVINYCQPSEWETFPFSESRKVTGQVRKVSIQAVFEPPAGTPALGYWTGRVVSQPCEVELEDNALHYVEKNRSGEYVEDGVHMTLSILRTNRETEFEVAFKNVGLEDVCLNLGMMLANGKIQVPNSVHLELKDEIGNTWRHFFPLSGIAGRVDDYVVPLKLGSTYAFTVPLDEFLSADNQRHERDLKPGRYNVSAKFEGTDAEYPNLDMQGIKLMRFWKGKLEEGISTVIR